MVQVRIQYFLGTDENGDPIIRRQTLPALDSATDDQLSNFVSNLATVVQPTIELAQKIVYSDIQF